MMSEAVLLQLLQVLMVAFPPLAALLDRYLPRTDDEPLAKRIRDILPLEGASSKARDAIERMQERDDGG